MKDHIIVADRAPQYFHDRLSRFAGLFRADLCQIIRSRDASPCALGQEERAKQLLPCSTGGLTIRRLRNGSCAFNTVEPAELDAIRPYWSGVDEAARLPRGEFIAVNRDSGGKLRGRLF
ncbi:MAG: hypothetical protein ACREFR_10980 [Limisphaerales bacterium]